MVVATTPDGEIGILPLHAPIVTTLAPGEVRLRFGDNAADWEYFSISGGYLQVHEDKVIVLADAAVAVSQIDVERAPRSRRSSSRRASPSCRPTPSDERDEMIRDLNWAETQLTRRREARRHVALAACVQRGGPAAAGSPRLSRAVTAPARVCRQGHAGTRDAGRRDVRQRGTVS